LAPQFPRRDSLSTYLLSEAYRIICRCHWADWPDESLVTFANDARYGVRIIIGSAGTIDPPKNGQVNIVTAPTFSAMEMDILRVMTSAPQTTRRLARRADRSAGSHFRQALADLCRKGIVIRTPDGYRWA
jgi:hypothetical protein